MIEIPKMVLNVPPKCKECNHRATEYMKGLEERIRADERAKFAHELKEVFNAEFPSNYRSTKPFFTLENVRMLVDEVWKEQK